MSLRLQDDLCDPASWSLVEESVIYGPFYSETCLMVLRTQVA